MLEAAVDEGVNLFDTAPLYGEGDSERLIGKVLGHRREQIVISTKVGLEPNRMLRLSRPLKSLARKAISMVGWAGAQQIAQRLIRSGNRVTLEPHSLIKSVEGSLQRLRTDRIDLVLIHRTPEAENIPEVVATLETLISAGKIQAYGATPQSSDEMALWLRDDSGSLHSLQVEFNACNYAEMLPLIQQARLQKVHIIAREVFAQGRLINTYAPTKDLGFLGKSYDPAFGFLGEFSPQLSVQQAALKLALQTSGVDTCVVGMSSLQHLRKNVAVFSLTDIPDQGLYRLKEMAQNSIQSP